MVHARSEAQFDAAQAEILKSINIGDTQPAASADVYQQIRLSDV